MHVCMSGSWVRLTGRGHGKVVKAITQVKDPDQTPVEHPIYSKYSNRQAGAISVDPDRTPAEYHLSSKYSDRQVGGISVDPDRTPAEYHLYPKYSDRHAEV